MFYGILILLLVLVLAAWIYEKREGIATLRAAKRYKSELEEERKWSDKMLSERNAALDKCEKLADENASFAHDITSLRKCTVAYAFSDWECIKDIEGVRDCYYEKDGIWIIIEDGKAIGWYHHKEADAQHCRDDIA